MSSAIFNAVDTYISQHILTTKPNITWQWRRFGQGSSNELYETRIDSQRYVLRINANSDLVVGCDRYHEHRVLKSVSTYKWGPNVIENRPADGWCLMQWCGRQLSSLLDPQHRKQMITAVSEWQQIEPSCHDSVIDYMQLFEQYRVRVKRVSQATALHRLIDQAAVKFAYLPVLPSVLVHHDLHLGNITLDGEQVRVLDWEYAGFGCAWFDIAVLVKIHNYSVDELYPLAQLSGFNTGQINQAVECAYELVQWLDCLWYWGRGLTGTNMSEKQLVKLTQGLVRQ